MKQYNEVLIHKLEAKMQQLEQANRELERDIAERKRAEEALLESEARFRSLVENATLGLYRTTPQGRILMANPTLVRMLGYRGFQELAARNLAEEGSEPGYPRSQFCERMEKDGEVRGLEEAWTRQDGSVIFVRESARAFRSEDGKVLYYDGIVEDITERKRAEVALRDAQALTNAIVDSTADMIWSVDSERFALLTFNRSLQDYYLHRRGVRLQSGMGQEDLFTDPKYIKIWRDFYQRALSEGSYTAEYGVSMGTNVLQLTFNLLQREGKVFGISVFGKDITERKRAEEALRESQERLKEAEHLAHVGSSSWNVATDISTWSDELYRIMGKDPREPAPTHAERAALYARESWARLESGVQRALATGEPYDMELEVVRPDGTRRQVHARGAAVRGDDGRIVRLHGTLQDITERKRAEQALRDSEQRYRDFIEHSNEGVWRLELERPVPIDLPGDEILQRILQYGYIAECNLAHARIAGFSTTQEMVGRRLRDLFQPADQERLESFRSTARGGLAGRTIEFRGLDKSGRLRNLSRTEIPIIRNGMLVRVWGITRDLTEQKAVEKAALEAESKYREIFERATEGIYRTSLDGKRLAANPALAGILGFDSAQEMVSAIGDSAHQVWIDPSEHSRFTALVQERGAVQGFDCQWKRHDGRIIWVSLDARIVCDVNGRALDYEGFVQDITERKRAEDALRESEGKYRSLVSNIPDVSWTLDANSHFVFISANIERVSGYSAEEVYQDGARLYLSSLHPEDFPKVREGFRALFSEGRPFDVEVRARRKDGAWRWVHHRALATYEKNGVRYADGLLSDITERKQAEAEHVRLVTAIEQSAEAVVITDPTGKIEYVNPAFTRITGYSREEALGKNPRILKSDKQNPAFYQELWATILSGQTWQGELMNQRKDGSLYTEHMNVAPVRDESGRVAHFIATKQDVTEYKSLEEHVRQSAKMEAIGRLAGGVAHDFNNLLTIINGYSELLLEQLGADAQASKYVDEVKNAGLRAASLTRQLLAFSRRQVLAPQVLDLNAVVSNLEKMLRRLIGEDVNLRTVLGPSLWRVKADPGQVEQVIMNLAVNARDAMPSGGQLTIETGNVELDEDFARGYVTVKPGPHAMLAVCDTGIGMTPETKAHIFEPFFTTKGEGKGTGLGLATVYGIVKQSGGSIWAYSEVGQGTVFKVYLPAVNESLAAETVNVDADAASGTETILVVEDQEAVRSLIRVALQSVGYKVLETDDPESALATCASHSGPIHLLLTDVVMPGLSGPLVAAKVSALRPDTKVLYMSGYTDDAVVHHGVLGHDMPFIQKPFSPAALRKKIREVLGRK